MLVKKVWCYNILFQRSRNLQTQTDRQTDTQNTSINVMDTTHTALFERLTPSG